MGVVIDITEHNFNREVLESKKAVLLVFYIEECTPCKMLEPILEQVALEEPNIKVARVNAESILSIVKLYDIKTVPTLMVIKNGAVVNRVSGVKSRMFILSMIR